MEKFLLNSPYCLTIVQPELKVWCFTEKEPHCNTSTQWLPIIFCEYTVPKTEMERLVLQIISNDFLSFQLIIVDSMDRPNLYSFSEN